eukprot:PhM_4_TR7221/c0_g1_i1/m.79078
MQDFPRTLLFEIFAYLPTPFVTTTPVCRSWYRAAHDTSFPSMYLTPTELACAEERSRTTSVPLQVQCHRSECHQPWMSSGVSNQHQHSTHTSTSTSTSHMVVDFVNSVITNLGNDEGTLSQIYYTHPCIVLQSRRKFSVFLLSCCHDPERIVFKKGSHIRCAPVAEECTFVVSARANDRLIKLDFMATRGNTLLRTVGWTESGIELFDLDMTVSESNLTANERREKYRMRPLGSHRALHIPPEAGFSCHDMLILHLNEAGVISILTNVDTGKVHFFDYESGAYVGCTAVPGPVSPERRATASTTTANGGGSLGEWKSRERFEFRGSNAIGGIIDDRGVVHIFNRASSRWTTLAPNAEHAFAPRYLRVHSDTLVYWCDRPEAAASYIDVWSVPPSRTASARKRISRTYASAIVSVHLDRHRLFVQVLKDPSPHTDTFIDIWALLPEPRPLVRCHNRLALWSPRTDTRRTVLSRLFWSDWDTLLYYELNHDPHEVRYVMSIRQISCVDRDAYMSLVRGLVSESGTALEEPPTRIESLQWDEPETTPVPAGAA